MPCDFDSVSKAQMARQPASVGPLAALPDGLHVSISSDLSVDAALLESWSDRTDRTHWCTDRVDWFCVPSAQHHAAVHRASSMVQSTLLTQIGCVFGILHGI